MPLPRTPLQALEAFEKVALSGSMRQAALEMKLSISSVSHHVARLEEQLGTALLDRSSRPLVLTREGREVLHHLSQGLDHLRRATSATAIGGLLGARALRIGIIEDFEARVTPGLATALAGQMPNAKLSIRSILSHEVPSLLNQDELDVAIASEPESRAESLICDPLLRDPFVLVTRKNAGFDPVALLDGSDALPFLRFNREHLIGMQVEAHLARNRITLPDRYAFDSVQSILAIVADGNGWSIITPLGFARAQRFAERVALHPLPLPVFARRISLMSRSNSDRPVAHAIAALLRSIVAQSEVGPIIAAYPWLAGVFATLDPSD